MGGDAPTSGRVSTTANSSAGSHAVPSMQKCPKCGGTAFKKFSLVYEEQSSSGRASSSTVGAGMTAGGAIGVGAANTTTRSVNQSELARRVAPPVLKNLSQQQTQMGCSVMLAAVVAAFLAGNLGGGEWALATFVGFLIGGIVAYNYFANPKDQNAKFQAEYKAACVEWHKQFLCLQCGNGVVLDLEFTRFDGHVVKLRS